MSKLIITSYFEGGSVLLRFGGFTSFNIPIFGIITSLSVLLAAFVFFQVSFLFCSDRQKGFCTPIFMIVCLIAVWRMQPGSFMW